MASADEDDNDAVLSDVEADDPVSLPSPEDVTVERFQEVLAELERERKARLASENAKSDLQVSFNRLKVLAHEAIKKRDEISKQRDKAIGEKDESLKLNEKLSMELDEAKKVRDETMKQKEELIKQFDEASKAKDSSRSEIETAAQMLVTGIDKIAGKVSSFKNFNGGGLPRSQKYSGLPAVSYGVIKRTNEIVEELLKQIDSATKSRNEAREQMEQRNYEIAVEVSQLEATISGLREEVSKQTSSVEKLEKLVVEKDTKISEIERDISEKQNSAEKQVNDFNVKLRNLESNMESQKSLLTEQLNLVTKIHSQLYDLLKIVDTHKSDLPDFSESFFFPQETDMEENIRASLAGMESLHELARVLVEKTRDLINERNHEIKSLTGTASQLAKEKEQVGSLLRSALSRRMSSNLSSKSSEIFKVAENGLRDAGIEFRFSNHMEGGEISSSKDKYNASETDDDEVYALAGALENIIRQSQLETIELQHTVDELREETSLLKDQVEAQSKELILRKQLVEELEEKERIANENVDGLMMDITAAEEEITRWKVAAQQEAAAGKAVEQEFLAQLSTLRHELKEAKQGLEESEKKLKFKEETAGAAMAARDAAEKSLRMADTRSSRLRDRVEELTRQLEELDNRERSQNGPRYVCWPWQWLGLNFVGSQQHSDLQQQTSNEMELSEPLI
ncbi:myosin heavy chain, non-muscle [Impatiens glandulifera]|uniref:myosin heavy chain, non-muscle n=1 Tax=Impatiens glandulifera TaxID=253017 RepID=UPI001FB060EA|nr:myosin heavy chain, non-muscle [Impatiens glandulifera]